MFPVEPTESFTTAKENDHSNRPMAEKKSFHCCSAVLVMLAVICQCGQAMQSQQNREFSEATSVARR